MLTAAGKVVRSCVDDALRLAGVEAGQIQLLESQGFTPTAEKNRLSRDVDVKQISKPLAPLKDLSTTGLAGLCGLGELSQYKVLEKVPLIRSCAVWRLRGWIPEQNTGLQNCLQHTSSYEGQAVTVVLSRSDGQAAPKYQDI